MSCFFYASALATFLSLGGADQRSPACCALGAAPLTPIALLPLAPATPATLVPWLPPAGVGVVVVEVAAGPRDSSAKVRVRRRHAVVDDPEHHAVAEILVPRRDDVRVRADEPAALAGVLQVPLAGNCGSLGMNRGATVWLMIGQAARSGLNVQPSPAIDWPVRYAGNEAR